MRHWLAETADTGTALLTDLVGELGAPAFGQHLLARLRPVVPAGTLSVYRTGPRPALFLTGAHGVPDTTRDCWRAYLSGPHRHDRSLRPATASSDTGRPLVCHITAREVRPEHRARVYDAHGMVERVSVVQREGEDLLAVNFYRHLQQRPFRDGELDDFGRVAPAVLALARKHLLLAGLALPAAAAPPASRACLLGLCPGLTPRELDVCEQLLLGRTHEGIARDLGLGVPTVKTYRNRAFQRLGIHFRNELYALVHAS
jgi:DNA-binding CsgD family transcriptional regulator